MNEFLEDFADEINKLKYENIFRIAEIKDGGEACAKTLKPSSNCLNSYSVAKAFTVTAIGLLYDKNILKTDEKIVDIFADELPASLDQRWNQVTVDMVLRHHAGLGCGFLDIDALDIYNFSSDDFLKYMFSERLELNPNEKWCYSDGAYYLLSRVVTKKTGRLLDELLWRELFLPLKFQEMAWSKCPLGYPMGATGLYIRTQDMAKLGLLYLQGGMYNGNSIFSKEWADITLSRKYELSPTGYGDSYGKGGMAGQMLLVIPSQNRVVAWHSFEETHDMSPLIKWVSEYKN